MTEQITIKLSDQHIISGSVVWGPNSDGVACVRLEDGSTMQGEFIPGLFDDGPKPTDTLPFE